MTTDQDKKRRNRRALQFFKDRNLDVRTIGNLDNPAFILNDDMVLNCYVRNFFICFMSAVSDGEELFRIKLTEIPADLDQELFMEWLHNYRHRDIFKVVFTDTPLFVSGYTFFDQDNKDHSDKEPVFSTLRPKIYFSRGAAQVIVDRFTTEQIKLEII